MIDHTSAEQALADPRTSGEVLAQIATMYPDLWSAVATHPHVYPALIDWLASRGDATAQRLRLAGQATASAPQTPGTVTPPYPAIQTPGMPAAQYAPTQGAPSAAMGYGVSPTPIVYAPGSVGGVQPGMVAPLAPAAPGYLQQGKMGVQRAFDSMTGFDGEAIVHFRDLFRDTFKRHTRADMDILMYSGTRAAQSDRRWRLPWLYARVFGVLLSAFVLLWLCMQIFSDNSGNVIPGVIFTGALIIPATVMVFFWEFNQARNVSLFDVIRIFFIGGALSILLTFIVSAITSSFMSTEAFNYGTAFVAAALIGFTEELAKAMAVFVLMRRLTGCLVSNGLLIGAVVGTGFAVFETMGYGTSGWIQGDLEWTLATRGVLSLGGHVVWAAILGAAIMLAQRPGSAVISLATMSWGRFLALFCVPFALHTMWDFIAFVVPSQWVQFALMAALIVVAWVFIVRLINSGLRQYANLLGQTAVV